jgi:epoxyqueuosine reductase
MELRHRLDEIALDCGLDRLGITTADPFADVRVTLERRKSEGLSAQLGFTFTNPSASTDIRASYPWAERLVVAGRAYLPEAGDPGPAEPGTGRIARFAVGDAYQPLREALETMATTIRRAGYRAETLSDDSRLVDRAAAVRAGLGWWGKNTMVLAPGVGPWLLLGSVATDAPLAPDEPMARDCGSCQACLPACPTGALIAPGILDARRCLAAWAQSPGVIPIEFREAMGDRLYGCDDCINACPPGHRLLSQSAGQPRGRVDLVDLLGAADQSLLDRFQHFYLPGRSPRVLRRNALVALGNSGDRRFVPPIAAYAGHPDWMLRAHAVWALSRLGGLAARAVLTARHRDESDRRVRVELEAAIG